jgi:5-methylcytosine-specific restriction endonuclease McrA
MAEGQCIGRLRPTYARFRKFVPCVQCSKECSSYGRKHWSMMCKSCCAHRANKIKSELAAIRRIGNWKPKKTRVIRGPTMVSAVCSACACVFQYEKGGKRRFCSRKCVASCLKVIKKIPFARSCVVCEVEFCPLPAFHHVNACSVDCIQARQRNQRREYKRKRKALARGANGGEYIDSIGVFERDQWKCKACGCHSSKHLRGTNDDSAPELDHIVPVSAGGSHTYENVQLLCRLCNMLKSDMSMAEFVHWNQSHGYAPSDAAA